MLVAVGSARFEGRCVLGVGDGAVVLEGGFDADECGVFGVDVEGVDDDVAAPQVGSGRFEGRGAQPVGSGDVEAGVSVAVPRLAPRRPVEATAGEMLASMTDDWPPTMGDLVMLAQLRLARLGGHDTA